MFFGTFEHNLDSKNRLVVPSRFVKLLSNKKLYIMRGYEGCLSLYPEEDFEKYIAKIQSFPFESKSSRDIARISLSSVYELSLDSVKRVQIPTALVEKYKISKEVVVLGMVDHIEIWSKKKWDKYLLDNEDKFEEISEKLSKNV